MNATIRLGTIVALFVILASPARGPVARGRADSDQTACADLAVGVPHEDASDDMPDTGGVNILYGSDAGLSAAGNQWWSQDSSDVEGNAEADDAFGHALAAGDLNGDGHADLAVCVSQEDASDALPDTGGVNVLYGSAAGLSAAGNQWWSQDSPGVEGNAEAGDFFGYPLAIGDLNGDGYDDLAVGVPWEDASDALQDSGGVNVLYGSAVGLSAVGNQWWSQDSPDIQGIAEAGDSFGRALAAGDLNGDGYDDLAIGVPVEGASDDLPATGGVNILYGSAAGLSAVGNQWWSQDSPDVEGNAEAGDLFGHALAVGDLDGDGYDDLAVGVPYEDASDALEDTGGVNVLYGSAAGLSAAGNQWWSQDSPDVEGIAEADDGFGFALAAGHLNGGAYADLAVGVPQEDASDDLQDSGGVNVLYGSAAGLSAVGNRWWSQDSPDVEGNAEANDWFGFALAAGDLDGDGYADLAVGVPQEDASDALPDTGGVNVLYGSFLGLSAVGNQWWSQDSPDVEGNAEANDWFGAALAIGAWHGSYRTHLPLVVRQS